MSSALPKKKENIPGLLLFFDFEKAFDTIEWPFIRKSLQHRKLLLKQRLDKQLLFEN